MFKITSNMEDVLKQFEEVKKQIDKNLTRMVYNFTYKIAEAALIETPFGDDDSNSYAAYLRRNPARLAYGLSVNAGSAKGGWNIKASARSTPGGTNIASDINAENIKSKFRIQLSLVNSVNDLNGSILIYNRVPYLTKTGFVNNEKYLSIEEGYSKQAPFGIIEPVFNRIFSEFVPELKNDFYNGI